jgi:hypothetical protein
MAPAGPASDVERLQFGERVSCSDGDLGELADIVIDPAAARVTHLVVQPDGQPGGSRLVPLALAVRGEQGQGIRLQCTVEQAHALEPTQRITGPGSETRPADEEEWDVGVQDVLEMPPYDAGAFVEYNPEPELAIFRLYDRIPKGEVEIRRSSLVLDSDGRQVGLADGVLLDDAQITHVLLRRGHLWRRHTVTVPIDGIESLKTDNVMLRLTKREVQELTG